MAADIAGDNGNGRITLALIGQKLDMVITKMDDLTDCYKEHGSRIGLLERGFDVRGERIKNIEDDMDFLNRRDVLGTVGVTIAAIIAGVIGWFK